MWSSWTEESIIELEEGTDSENSAEDDYVTADEGYDADVELKTSFR